MIEKVLGLTPEQKYESHCQEMVGPPVTKRFDQTREDLDICVEALRGLQRCFAELKEGGDPGLRYALGCFHFTIGGLPPHIKERLK